MTARLVRGLQRWMDPWLLVITRSGTCADSCRGLCDICEGILPRDKRWSYVMGEGMDEGCGNHRLP